MPDHQRDEKRSPWGAGLIALLVALAPSARADNPGAIAGVHAHGSGVVSLSVGLAPETFPQYEGSDEGRFYLFPLIDLTFGRRGEPWMVYAGASRNEVPLGQGVGVYPIHTARWIANVEIARTDRRPESRGDALAGLGDRRANYFVSTRIGYRFWNGIGQADLSIAHGLRDDAGTLAFLRVELSKSVYPWFYASAAKLTVADARSLTYDFGITGEAAAERRSLASAGDPRLTGREAGPYLPGGGPRNAELTVSGGYSFGSRVRVFGYARGGRLLSNAAESPIVRTRTTYLLGAGVTALVF